MNSLKFEGYYYFFDGSSDEENIFHSSNYILRFYEKDHSVISVTIGISETKDEYYYFNDFFPNWDGWFSRFKVKSYGYYDIFEDKIRFEIGNVFYMGIINNDSITLFSHSNINGHNSIENFKFINFRELDHNIEINDIDDSKSPNNNNISYNIKDLRNSNILKELDSVYFIKQNLKNIPIELYNLKNLNWLEISYNKIKEFPKEICYLENLEILSLRVNALKIIPKEIGNLMNLKLLDIGQNSLKSIPEEIYGLKNLKVLSLKNNLLKAISKEIGNLNYLTLLDISYNKIKEIPIEIACLENLERLYLNDNKLTTIPEEIETLKNLRVIKVDNKFSVKRFLEDEHDNLEEVKKLNLENKSLSKLPFDIINMNQLESLKINDNQLIHLPHFIGKLENLKRLYLQNNKLETLSGINLTSSNLEKIYIDGNLLLDVPKIYKIENDYKSNELIVEIITSLLYACKRKQLDNEKIKEIKKSYYKYKFCIFLGRNRVSLITTGNEEEQIISTDYDFDEESEEEQIVSTDYDYDEESEEEQMISTDYDYDEESEEEK